MKEEGRDMVQKGPIHWKTKRGIQEHQNIMRKPWSAGSGERTTIKARPVGTEDDDQMVSKIEVVTTVDVFHDTRMSAKGSQPCRNQARRTMRIAA